MALLRDWTENTCWHDFNIDLNTKICSLTFFLGILGFVQRICSFKNLNKWKSHQKCPLLFQFVICLSKSITLLLSFILSIDRRWSDSKSQGQNIFKHFLAYTDIDIFHFDFFKSRDQKFITYAYSTVHADDSTSILSFFVQSRCTCLISIHSILN